jgi:O-antigen/teichoic acid export membrane protein
VFTKANSFLFRFPSFISNFLALGTGSLSLLVIQLISLPLFLIHFTRNQYAIWLTSYSIAQLALLLDFGTIGMNQNQLSYLHSKGRKREIVEVLKQTSNIIILMNAVFFIFILFLSNLNLISLDVYLIAFFMLSNILQSFSGLLEGMLRIESKVARGLHLSNCLRGAEFLGTVFAVVNFSESLVVVVMISFFSKFLFFIGMIFFTPKRFSFVKFGHIQPDEIMKLIKQGFPFFLSKVSDIISINGVIIVLSRVLSATDLVIFASTRTFFRFGLQLTSLVSHSFAYEMSTSWIENNLVRMRILVRHSFRSVFLLGIFIAIIYEYAGPLLMGIWTNYNIQPEKEVFTLGAVYSLLLSINQNQKSRFNAINCNFQASSISLSISAGLLLVLLNLEIDFSLFRLLVILCLAELLAILSIAFVTRNTVAKCFKNVS